MPAKTGFTPAAPGAAKTKKASAGAVVAPDPVDPEVGAPPPRRVFSAKEKLRILTEADQAAASGVSGAIGAILRREGIYSSMLSEWRRRRDDGVLNGLTPQPRGPKPEPVNPLSDENVRLRRENAALKERLARAEQIIDLQKKLSEMLAIPLPNPDSDGSV